LGGALRPPLRGRRGKDDAQTIGCFDRRSIAEAFAFAIRDYYQSASVVGYFGAVQFIRDRDGAQRTTAASIATFDGFGDQMLQAGSAIVQNA
jgi:hypothetical protein